MPDYTPEEWEANDFLTPEQTTAMSQELEEQEQHDLAQDASIAEKALKHPAAQRIQEFNSASGPVSLTNQPIPAGAVGVRITCIPPGNGGGSGRRGAPGTTRCGGGGAAGIAFVRDIFLPIPAGVTQWAIELPIGGLGGAAVTTDDTNGNDGELAPVCYFRWVGNESFFFQTQTTLAPGRGGTATTGPGGSLGTAPGYIVGGSASTSGAAGGNGVESMWSDYAPSAGAGGGITSANVPNNGGNGARTRRFSCVAGTGGVVDGALPTAGSVGAPMAGYQGLSGGGGAASVTQAAQAGADGIGYGSAGGGGGASTNGFNSGRGGNGGPGYLRLEWVFE